MRRIRLIAILLISLLIFTACNKGYEGVYIADESEYLEVLQKSRSDKDAELVLSSLKEKFGDDWNKIKVSKGTMEENGVKSRISVKDNTLYVDVSATLKEMEKYVGSVVSDISENQKWGTFSQDYNTLTSVAGYKYYKSK